MFPLQVREEERLSSKTCFLGIRYDVSQNSDEENVFIHWTQQFEEEKLKSFESWPKFHSNKTLFFYVVSRCCFDIFLHLLWHKS